jgi:mRNA-degrading endonuclease toxin of MazEF toxin-antitoxin module
VNRGEIWWADLAEPRGSEPDQRRPVLKFLTTRVAALPASVMASVDAGLRLTLALGR